MVESKKKLSVTQKMAATAGAMAVLTPATTEADIIYVDDAPVSASAFDGQGSSVDWDVDGAGGADFQMWVRSSSFFTGFYNSSNSFSYSFNAYGILNFASRGYSGTALNGRGLVGPGGVGANALNGSFDVGPTLANYTWGASDVSYRSAARFDSFYRRSNFGGGTNSSTFYGSGVGAAFVGFQEGTNFLGFRFDINGNLHYGWAEVEFSGASLTINRWAYESDANTAIHVGSIPEPNSLGLLAMGAVGVLAMRRKRESKTKEV